MALILFITFRDTNFINVINPPFPYSIIIARKKIKKKNKNGK